MWKLKNVWLSWISRIRSQKSGIRAEAYFLGAVNRLGFVIVRKTNPRWAYTVRRSTAAEDQRHIDFIFTTKIGERVVKIPLELVTHHDLSEPRLQKKIREAGEGRMALFWPGQGHSHRQFVEMLRKACEGEREALTDVRRGLDLAFAEYLRLNHKI